MHPQDIRPHGIFLVSADTQPITGFKVARIHHRLRETVTNDLPRLQIRTESLDTGKMFPLTGRDRLPLSLQDLKSPGSQDIIRIQYHDKPPSRPSDCFIMCRRLTRILLPHVVDRQAGGRRPGLDNGLRVICRTIIDNQHFEIPAGLLLDTLQGSWEQVRAIACWDK